MKFAYFQGRIVPFTDAKINIMTHAFNYGTAVFEGIRGYWNADKNQMFLVKLREHNERLIRSAGALQIKVAPLAEELDTLITEVARQNGYKEDIYVRPIAYKSQLKVGLGLTGIEDELCVYTVPFGNYLDINEGIKVIICSWKRIPRSSLPHGAKICGAYFNSSLAKAEAVAAGAKEAILLSQEDSVAEGSGENLFLVKNGRLITPYLEENILPGITRAALIELAKKDLGMEVVERRVLKDELYSADELFFCGTGAQVSPISEIDGIKINRGKVGEATKKIQQAYFAAVRGVNPKYSSWLTPVY